MDSQWSVSIQRLGQQNFIFLEFNFLNCTASLDSYLRVLQKCFKTIGAAKEKEGDEYDSWHVQVVQTIPENSTKLLRVRHTATL